MVSDWSISGVDLHLDPASPGPGGRRARLEAALRTAVRDGRLASGARLPPTRTLAVELGVARGTVTAAYDQLAAEGYLIARRGAGTVVADLRGGGSGLNLARLAQPGAHWSSEPDRIRHDLMPGRPDVASFPVEAWVRTARRVLPRVRAEVFANGDPRGLPELRHALADYLGRARGVRADPDAIVVTSGIMQSIGLLAEVLHGAGVRNVAMEEPSLPFHQEAVRRRGPEVVPMAVDEFGARCEFGGRAGGAGGAGEAYPVAAPDTANAAADTGPDAGPAAFPAASGVEPEEIGAAVLTPAHQAGFGVVLAPERRRAFVQWARSTGGLIVEDDYDGEFRYDRQPVGALQGMAPEQVAYLGTASKTLAPALRMGWMMLPPELVAPVAEAKFYTDVQNEVLGQVVLAELIRSLDYDRHVRTQRQRYRARRDALLRRLRDQLPEVRVHGAAAGVQLLLELPASGPSEEQVLDQARRRGLRLVAFGGVWQRPDRPPVKGIGVGYGTPPEHAYPAALDALIETLQAAFDSRPGRPARQARPARTARRG